MTDFSFPKRKYITLRGKRVWTGAVHESGHALAMWLTRTAWGHERPLNSITILDNNKTDEVVPTDSYGWQREGGRTNSEYYTPEMLALPNMTPDSPVDDAFYDGLEAAGMNEKAWMQDYFVRQCKEAGINLEAWALDVTLGSLAGPVAQWFFEGSPGNPADYFMPENSPGVGDYQNLRTTLGYLRLDDEQLNNALSIELNRAVWLVEDNRKAISALAVALPRAGTLDGDKASAILAANFTGGRVAPRVIAPGNRFSVFIEAKNDPSTSTARNSA